MENVSSLRILRQHCLGLLPSRSQVACAELELDGCSCNPGALGLRLCSRHQVCRAGAGLLLLPSMLDEVYSLAQQVGERRAGAGLLLLSDEPTEGLAQRWG